MIVADREFSDDYVEDGHEGGIGALDLCCSLCSRICESLCLKNISCHHTSFSRIYHWTDGTMYPIDLQELQNIQGVGAGKAKR